MPCTTHQSWGGGPLHLGIGVTKENTIVKHWTEQHFTYIKKRQRKISFSSGHWSPVASSLSWQPAQGDWPMLTTVLPQRKEHWSPPPALWSLKYWKLGCAWGPLTHRLKQNKGVLNVPETGKDIPTQGDKPSTGCVDSLSLCKEVF